jgi:signal transduction histidine kinase
MRRRLHLAVMTAVIAALAVFALPLGLGVTALLGASAGRETERVALEAAFRIGPTFAAGDPVELPADAGAAIGLYTPSGVRVSGSGPSRLEDGVKRARAGSIVQTDVHGDVVVAVPVTANEQVIGVVRAARADGIVGRSIAVWGALAAVAAFVIAGSALLARRTAIQLAVPVERLATAAREMGEGRLEIEPQPSGIEEVDAAHRSLADAGRRIADLVAREQRTASDASHQLRTPLAGLRARLELALADPGQDRDAVLTVALAQVDRLDSTIDDLIALARPEALNGESCDPAAVSEERGAHWRPLFSDDRRSLAVTVENESRRAAAPSVALGTALDVLLDNALRHGDGDVEIVARRHGGVIAFEVISGAPYSGPNDPFSDGESGDGGSGLGLGLARRAVEGFGGRLLLAETAPRTRFELLIPAQDGSGAG